MVRIRIRIPNTAFLEENNWQFCLRLDRAQENLHFLIDICENFLYILETEEPEVKKTPREMKRRKLHF
jgi:hypothetical protein